MRIKRAVRIFLSLVFCLLLFSAARAEEGGMFFFRIRPQVEKADLEQEDGSLYIGSGRKGKQLTAGLRIASEGLSREGNTWDLARLMADCEGRVLQARWHAEVKEPGALTVRLRLVPEGETADPLRVSAAAGWNMFDLSAWTADFPAPGEELCFSLEGNKKTGTNYASVDVGRSWIYLTLWLEHPPEELERELITDSEMLDIALSALPENHWALLRYREISGSLTRALWPETGVPYYFGGHSEEKVMNNRYFPQQESRYYKKNRLYLCGFDCGSFLHWVEEKAGRQPHDGLSTLLRQRASLCPLTGLDSGEWSQVLLPGDLVVFNHGTLHVGMYLGTPRMFGLTAEENPELADWLDAPLMIHCGEDPFCYDRFSEYIDAQDFRMDTSPPDGGVTVSLIVPKTEDAPRFREAPWGTRYGYFTVMNQPLTAFPLEDVTEIAWFRPVSI